MLMYNLIEYSDNYETCGRLWQYCRGQTFLNNAGTIIVNNTCVFHMSLNKNNR